MLSTNSDVIRMFLHLTAAAVWVGGQFALAGVVPALRRRGLDMAVKLAAQGFARVAWPAFGILVLTGVWNLAAANVTDRSAEYHVTLFVKLLLVGASAAGGVVHTLGRSKAALAVGGAVGFVTAIGALFFGVLLVRGA